MAVTSKQKIRKFNGIEIGSVETLADGDKVARDFYGKILGYYRSKKNHTTNFYGKILAQGDITTALIWEEYYKHHNE